MKRWFYTFVCFTLFSIALPAQALVYVGTDLFYSGFGWVGHGDVLVKTHTYLFLGGENFRFGPVVNYNKNRHDSEEIGVGGGLYFGAKFFVELDGTVYTFHHRGDKAEGYQASLILGWNFSKHLRLAVPITYTEIQSGDFEDQWRASFVPHVGLQAGF